MLCQVADHGFGDNGGYPNDDYPNDDDFDFGAASSASASLAWPLRAISAAFAAAGSRRGLSGRGYDRSRRARTAILAARGHEAAVLAVREWHPHRFVINVEMNE